jgi:hypothetical protein
MSKLEGKAALFTGGNSGVSREGRGASRIDDVVT